MSDLLTTRGVAEELHVSTETILRWVRAGHIPHTRLPGGGIRVQRQELEAWLASRHVDAV